MPHRSPILRRALSRLAEPLVLFPVIGVLLLVVVCGSTTSLIQVERASTVRAASASSSPRPTRTSRFPDGTQAVPIDLAEDSPARERFYTQFTGKSPAQVKAHWSNIIFTGRGQPPREAASSSEAKKLIAENPNAIGYIDGSAVDGAVRVVPSR